MNLVNEGALVSTRLTWAHLSLCVAMMDLHHIKIKALLGPELFNISVVTNQKPVASSHDSSHCLKKLLTSAWHVLPDVNVGVFNRF